MITLDYLRAAQTRYGVTISRELIAFALVVQRAGKAC